MRMENRIGMAVAILVGLIGPAGRTSAGYIDAYHAAEFTGQLGSGPNIRAPFNSVLSPSGQVTGSFVYDDALIPPSGSGFVNVFFSSFPDTAATGFPTGQNLINGTINIGSANLTNVHTFEPTIVPEPSALASMGIAGVATLGLAWRRRGPIPA